MIVLVVIATSMYVGEHNLNSLIQITLDIEIHGHSYNTE